MRCCLKPGAVIAPKGLKEWPLETRLWKVTEKKRVRYNLWEAQGCNTDNETTLARFVCKVSEQNVHHSDKNKHSWCFPAFIAATILFITNLS